MDDGKKLTIKFNKEEATIKSNFLGWRRANIVTGVD